MLVTTGGGGVVCTLCAVLSTGPIFSLTLIN